nr:class II heat shock protein [Tanacetum cinerariifolium]
MLREMPTTLGEAFSLACITEAHFVAIVHKDKATTRKEQSIKKTTDTIISLRNEVASPKVKGSLDVDEDIENKEIVKEVVVGGGEALGVDEYETNRVILVLKDGCGEFDDSLDETNLGLSEEFVIRVLKGRDVSGEKSREVFSVMPWATEGIRSVLCYVQSNERRKKKKMKVAI